MTQSYGAWRATYTPGSWVVLSGPSALVVMQPAPARMSTLVNSIWDAVVDAASISDLVARLSAFGLDRMKNFGAFFWDADGMHSLARGKVVVVDPQTGETLNTGEGVVTWREASLPQRLVRIDLEPVDQDEVLQLPLVVGAVTASAIQLDATGTTQAVFPAAREGADVEDAGAGAPEPARAPLSLVPTLAAADSTAPEPEEGAVPAADEGEDLDDALDNSYLLQGEPADDHTADDEVDGLESPGQQSFGAPVAPPPSPFGGPVGGEPTDAFGDLRDDTVIPDAPAPEPLPAPSEPADTQRPAHGEPLGSPAPGVAPASASQPPAGWGAPPAAPPVPGPPPVGAPAPAWGAPVPAPGGPGGFPGGPQGPFGGPQQQPSGAPWGQPPMPPQGSPQPGVGPWGQPPMPPQGQTPPWGAPPGMPQAQPQFGGQPGQPFGAPQQFGAPVQQPPASAPSAAPSPWGQAPQQQPNQPSWQQSAPRPVEDEHDGHTIFMTGIAATHKPGQGARPHEEGLVLASMCAAGHANPPGSQRCRLCPAPVDANNPRLVNRPSLATLHASSGDSVDVVGAVLIGRAPSGSGADAGATTLKVPSPSSDISRTHVRVAPQEWNLVATDLHSTNGTILRHEGEPPIRLNPGESVTIEVGDVLDLGDGVTIEVGRPA